MSEGDAELITGRQAFAEAVSRLIGTAHARVDLYSVNLERDIYATPDTLVALRQWVTQQPRAQVRIMVHQGQPAMFRGNELIELGLHLSSYVSFRDPPANMEPLGDMLIVDNRSLLRRPTPESTQAELFEAVPLKAVEAGKAFEELWNAGLPSQHIRHLHL